MPFDIHVFRHVHHPETWILANASPVPFVTFAGSHDNVDRHTRTQRIPIPVKFGKMTRDKRPVGNAAKTAEIPASFEIGRHDIGPGNVAI